MSDEKSLIIYYSRRGQNYVNGEIVDLEVGNTEVIVDYISLLPWAQKILAGYLLVVFSLCGLPWWLRW